MEKYENMLKQLQNGERESIEIQKEEFYEFREILVKHHYLNIIEVRPSKMGELSILILKHLEVNLSNIVVS